MFHLKAFCNWCGILNSIYRQTFKHLHLLALRKKIYLLQTNNNCCELTNNLTRYWSIKYLTKMVLHFNHHHLTEPIDKTNMDKKYTSLLIFYYFIYIIITVPIGWKEKIHRKNIQRNTWWYQMHSNQIDLCWIRVKWKQHELVEIINKNGLLTQIKLSIPCVAVNEMRRNKNSQRTQNIIEYSYTQAYKY